MGATQDPGHGQKVQFCPCAMGSLWMAQQEQDFPRYLWGQHSPYPYNCVLHRREAQRHMEFGVWQMAIAFHSGFYFGSRSLSALILKIWKREAKNAAPRKPAKVMKTGALMHPR